MENNNQTVSQPDNPTVNQANNQTVSPSVNSNFYPTVPYQYIPLSPWAYIGYELLFSIPIIGFICLLIFSFNNSNINRRNFARSYFCILLIVIILAVVMGLLGVSLNSLKK